MAKLMWAVLCDRLIVDQQTNKATHVDLIQSLAPRQLPARLPRVILATTWKRDGIDEPLLIKVAVSAPTGTQTTLFEADPITFEDAQFWRANFNLEGLEISSPGEHTLRISTKRNQRWKKEFDIPLTILDPAPA